MGLAMSDLKHSVNEFYLYIDFSHDHYYLSQISGRMNVSCVFYSYSKNSDESLVPDVYKIVGCRRFK